MTRWLRHQLFSYWPLRDRLYACTRVLLVIALGLTAYCLVLSLALFIWPVFWGTVFWAAWRGLRRRVRASGEFGTAAFANDNPGEIEAAGLFGGTGLCVGEAEDKPRPAFLPLLNPLMGCEDAVRAVMAPKPRLRTVRVNSFPHVSVFAPTGAGKGQSIILPFLLNRED